MYFPIFPASGENAILTAVMVGVLWMFVLMETIGWPFSGLIVPGFLAAIYVVDPIACMVTVGEAAISAVIAWLLTDFAARIGLWNRFFGRDQFFLVVLVSTMVRLGVEWGWLDAWAQAHHGGLLGSLNGVGLVLVPLVSYTLYRAGVGRGIPQILVPAALSWAVLVYLIMPYTNLSLATFQLDHEDLRQQLTENPRTWILLLTGSSVASRVKLRFGWDFGGIVVPGLLAIAWLTPMQLIGTIAEVLTLTLAMHIAVALPFLRTANLTGGRPLILCFLIEYVLQQGVTYFLGQSHPELRVSHILGIGYIMPSLLAVRCWRTGDTMRILLPALGTSLVGALLGTGLSLVLSILNPFLEGKDTAPPITEAPLLALGSTPIRIDAPLQFDVFWWQERNFAKAVTEGKVPPDSVGLTTNQVNGNQLIYEEGPFYPRGLGSALIRPEGQPLTIEVGDLERSALGLVTGLALQQRLDARALVVRSGRVALPSSLSAGTAAAGLEVVPVEVSTTGTRFTVPENYANQELVTKIEGLFELKAETGDSLQLWVDETAALRFAEALYGTDPTPWPGLLTAAMGDETVIAEPLLATGLEPMLLDQLVLQPVLATANAQARPGSLRLAAGLATQMGLRVYRGVDPAGMPIVAIGTPPNSGLPSWTVVVRAGGVPQIIELPDACIEEGMMPLGYSLWQRTHAAIFFARCGRPDEMDRPALSASSVYATIFRRALLSLPPEQVTIASIRGWTAYSTPGADIIVTRDHLTSVDEPLPDWLNPLLDPFREAGATVWPFTAMARQFGFRDPFNPRRKLTSEVVGDRYATVYVSPAIRAWFQPTLQALEEERLAYQRGTSP